VLDRDQRGQKIVVDILHLVDENGEAFFQQTEGQGDVLGHVVQVNIHESGCRPGAVNLHAEGDTFDPYGRADLRANDTDAMIQQAVKDPVGKARRVVLNRLLVGRLRSLSLGATTGVIETAMPKSRKARSPWPLL
jgi:hypothetical protein